MRQTPTMEQLTELRGSSLYSSDRDKIGSVEEVFVDEETGEPEWIGLGTGVFGTKRVLVPVAGAELRDGGIHVPYSKKQVKGTPDTDSDKIGQETERALYAHYGLEYTERRSETGLPERAQGGVGSQDAVDTGLPAGTPDSPGDTTEGPPVLTRSEEELRVGKREVEAGRLRLHKWVETQQVEVPVDVRREKARVTREPIEASVSGSEIGEESIDVTLSEEEPVVQKETVAKERIGVETEVELERETVEGDVRKERVDFEAPTGTTAA